MKLKQNNDIICNSVVINDISMSMLQTDNNNRKNKDTNNKKKNLQIMD